MDDFPLAVPPKRAAAMLGYGLTKIYELLHSGELQSFKHEGARRITVASIRAHIERNVQSAGPMGERRGAPIKTKARTKAEAAAA